MVANLLPPGPNKKPKATRRRFDRGTAPAVKSAERKRRNREAASDLRKRKALYELSLEKTADGLDADVAALRRREAELATRIAWYEHSLGPTAAEVTTSEGADEVMAIGSPASTCSSGYDSMSDSMSDSEPAADRDNGGRCPLSPNHDDRSHENESRHPRRTHQQDTPGLTPETEPSTPSLNDPPTHVGQQQQHAPRIVHRSAGSSRHSPALRPTDGAAARMGGTPSLGALTKPAVELLGSLPHFPSDLPWYSVNRDAHSIDSHLNLHLSHGEAGRPFLAEHGPDPGTHTHQHDHLALCRGEHQDGRHGLYGLAVDDYTVAAAAAILPFGDLADDDCGPEHGLQGATRQASPYPDQGIWLDEHPELTAAVGNGGEGAGTLTTVLVDMLDLEYLNSYLGVLQSCGEGRLTTDPEPGSTLLLPAPPGVTATDLGAILELQATVTAF